MRPSAFGGGGFGDEAPVRHDHAADGRVGAGVADTRRRQRDGAAHPAKVVF
jgi:hypothetical protein